MESKNEARDRKKAQFSEASKKKSKATPVLVVIVLALVVGERSFGIVGALLAVPVASVVVAVFRFLHRKLAVLDERAAVPPVVVPAPAPEPAPREPF